MSARGASILGTVLSLSFLAGCGGGEEPAPPAPPLGPTFAHVLQDAITTKRCGAPLCHSTVAGGFKLGPKDQLYSQLVDQPASGAKCRPGAVDGGVDGGTETHIRVVPGDPEASLLFLKVDHRPPCGDAMPVSGTLPQEQVTLIHDWIEAGAKND